MAKKVGDPLSGERWRLCATLWNLLPQLRSPSLFCHISYIALDETTVYSKVEKDKSFIIHIVETVENSADFDDSKNCLTIANL